MNLIMKLPYVQGASLEDPNYPTKFNFSRSMTYAQKCNQIVAKKKFYQHAPNRTK